MWIIMGTWRPHPQMTLALVVTLVTVFLAWKLPQEVEGQSFFPSPQQCLRFPRSSLWCSILPVRRAGPPTLLNLYGRRPHQVRRPPPPKPFVRGRRQNQKRRPIPPLQSAEESVESKVTMGLPDSSDNTDHLINPLNKRPHPMGMEMNHLLSLPPVTFTKVQEEVKEPSTKTKDKKTKKRPAKVKWRISETNTIENEMDHLSRLMAWQPKTTSTARPPPSTTAKAPTTSTSEEPSSEMTSSVRPMMMNSHMKRRPSGSSWMKNTMEEMPTVMKTIPLMTTFAKAALILNRKSKQGEGEEEQQQKQQQQEFNSNRPDFFAYTNAFLLFSKDPMGPVRMSERKRLKKKKKKEVLPELTQEELAEEERIKREQKKSEKIRRSIERLHLTRAVMGVVADSFNLASNKINLINTVAGSSLIGGGNNNPGGGGGGGGGGLLNKAKEKVKLQGQKFTSLIKAAASAGVSGSGIISGILGKNPILNLPFQARANLSEVVDSYANIVTREAIHNATLSELV